MKNSFIGLLLIPIIWGCSVDSDKKKIQQKVINNIEDNIILPSYEMLYERVLDLQFSIERLDIADADALLQARDSWVDAREIWEQTEGYILDYDAASPLKFQLDKYTLAKDADAQKSIALGAYQRLEQLLWGEQGQKQAHELTEQELLEMNTAALDIAVSTQKLLQQVNREIKHSPMHHHSSVSKSSYCRKRMQRYVDNMLDLTQNILITKIEIPFNQSALQLSDAELESQYSDNSKSDIMNNILGLEHLYSGSLDLAMKDGISSLVRLENERLDQQIVEALAESKRAVSGLPESYAMALTHDRDAITFAKYKIKLVHDLIHDELIPIVQTL